MKQKESTKEVLDDTDIAILEHIQQDGRMSNSKLAEKVNLSETPCWRRWKRMEETGYIDGYAAKLNRKKLGLHVAGFTLVTLGNHEVENTEPFEEFVAVTDWIPMCHCIAGGADYMVQVLAKDLEEYFERISSIRRVKGVSAIQSNISVKELKNSYKLPLGE
ncbi:MULTISPECIES: Lrp/AsnC family transcriptional regulator [Vibrio]|uniref:AsnC family transcriptional regulator n=3 Tax=Vibrio cyclitrophicus TaxID=47951 RepID=A0A7Z1MM05_9VIBR|nr:MULTISPECIES: Lrp/AsnC family transcriptional regulator [Vibrio]KNH10560.1 AsnC family transcriptional regulator [Vibrio lentus]MBY7663176.1 Lrp/AsnC family transcriptional regulator [Vibrio atlanticus]ERM61370.1 Transcriptional regulator, AsnC family [Vibrio cyclitrophicus FF75]KAA8599551.1 Transcriptional regulator AsnC family [Vibrio cyclitrophicus]MBE8558809.1 Lrp/AsnC family transcriptional regulator [Vibrio sp. OPT24]